MKTLKRFAIIVLAGAVWLGGVELGEWFGGYESGEGSSALGIRSLVPTAEAVVGRPLTPVSVAGVARRTARRN